MMGIQQKYSLAKSGGARQTRERQKMFKTRARRKTKGKKGNTV